MKILIAVVALLIWHGEASGKDWSESEPTHFARVNRLTLAYQDLGPATAPAVVLIQGFGQQMIAWPDGIIDGLVDAGFRVIRFDNREVGLSSKFYTAREPRMLWNGIKYKMGLGIREVYPLKALAWDVDALMAHLNIESAHIVGVSMGGMVAQLLAIHFPSRVQTLTSIMSTTGNRDLPGPREDVFKAMIKRHKGGMENTIAAKSNLMRLIGSQAHPYPDGHVESLVRKQFVRSYYPPGRKRQALAIADAKDRTEALGKLTMPALVIHGSDDPMLPVENGKATANAIPGSTFVEIPEMGHGLEPYFHSALLAPMLEMFGQVAFD